MIFPLQPPFIALFSHSFPSFPTMCPSKSRSCPRDFQAMFDDTGRIHLKWDTSGCLPHPAPGSPHPGRASPGTRRLWRAPHRGARPGRGRAGNTCLSCPKLRTMLGPSTRKCGVLLHGIGDVKWCLTIFWDGNLSGNRGAQFHLNPRGAPSFSTKRVRLASAGIGQRPIIYHPCLDYGRKGPFIWLNYSNYN